MMKMVTGIFVSLLFIFGSTFTKTCGPEACGLICAEEESCLQDLEVRGDMTGQWSVELTD